jgi:hypothetical protein
MYLNEIGQVDLLNADDEKRLGRAIKDGLDADVQLKRGIGTLGVRDRRALQRVVTMESRLKITWCGPTCGLWSRSHVGMTAKNCN